MSNQKGNVIIIYQDPTTELKPEGPAQLCKKILESGNLEYWQVRFLEDGKQNGKKAPLYSRWIRKPESKDMASRGA